MSESSSLAGRTSKAHAQISSLRQFGSNTFLVRFFLNEYIFDSSDAITTLRYEWDIQQMTSSVMIMRNGGITKRKENYLLTPEQ